MDEDKILYYKFLSGDQKALEKLIDMYKDNLILFLFGYLKNMGEAENMMIDVFAQLVTSSKKYKEKASLKTYIYTIARNEALRYLKKNNDHLTLDEVHADLFHGTDFVEIQILKNDQNRHLYSAILQLPADYKEILLLLYFEDMNYKEAARIMKKSEKQITNLSYRAKKTLKIILEKEGFIYDRT